MIILYIKIEIIAIGSSLRDKTIYYLLDKVNLKCLSSTQMQIPAGIWKSELDLCREISARNIDWKVFSIKYSSKKILEKDELIIEPEQKDSVCPVHIIQQKRYFQSLLKIGSRQEKGYYLAQ